MNILLISGGFIDADFAADFCREKHFDKMIAVDGGLKTADCLRLGAQPFDGVSCTVLTDIVGDFDTVDPALLEKYGNLPQKAPTDGQMEAEMKKAVPGHLPPVIHQFNPEKDYTDTDIALKLAIDYCERAAEAAQEPGDKQYSCQQGMDSEIWILGATGTRLDHVLANISMLLLPFKRGIRAWIVDAHNRICLVSGKRVIEKSKSFGKYLSLIPLTPEISGVTLTGVKYPLRDHTVLLGESLCVSNEITQEQAVIEVKEGIAVVLETRD